VAIGSNAGHRARHLNAALALLRTSAPSSLTLQATSFLYETTPVGSPPEHANQPRFLNAVLEVRTTLEPLALLDVLKAIEHRLGRDAQMVRNGPRVIDLDIISTSSPPARGLELAKCKLHVLILFSVACTVLLV
jgi:2-amino-4-hydroxy-6-hydroxymethyldihydropteridine diphosphokinase